MNTLGSFEVNKVEIYRYCIFNGENYLDLMKFFPEEEVVELWSKQGKRYIKIDNSTFCEGDIILGKVGHYGWQKKTIEELQEMIKSSKRDKDIEEMETRADFLWNENELLKSKLNKLEKQVAELTEELNTEQAHAGDLWDELLDLKNGYDPKEEMPDIDEWVLVQFSSHTLPHVACLNKGDKWSMITGAYNRYRLDKNVIRWWHLPKYETDNPR